MNIGALAPNVMKQRWHSVSQQKLHVFCNVLRLVEVNCCDAPFTKHLHEDYEVWQLHIKYVNEIGPFHNRKLSPQRL